MAKSENRWSRWRGGRSDDQAAHVVGDGTTARRGAVSGETCAWGERVQESEPSWYRSGEEPREAQRAKLRRGTGGRKVEV
jgi:hypothetical protein